MASQQSVSQSSSQNDTQLSTPSDTQPSPASDAQTSPPGDTQPSSAAATPEVQHSFPTGQDGSPRDTSSKLPTSALSSWARSLRISSSGQEDSQQGNAGKSTFARFTSGFGLRTSPKASGKDENSEAQGSSTSVQPGVLGSFTKGLVDSSKNAVKVVQVKARHIVSQNKRRYQEGGFDLDMTYITENIIAMGFPAGDMSSGFFGYVEGFYRNHMEEVIKFFETHHKDDQDALETKLKKVNGKYKVYNLCSERLYDASLLEGKVACFPFDDHNCPPLQLVISFCQSAYSWLKEDIENVVVVHCKAGMARTGLMISSLLLYLKFFPTAEESMDYYNQKRCLDGKGLVLPSQIRYVKYFERILTYFNGENPPGRRCMLRGFRLHRCPYWVRPSITVSNHNGVLFSTKKHPRTKDLMPEDFWFSAPKKGIMVFALPGEPGLTELAGDFKIHFHDRQGDFYCWLNTTMTENRKILNTSDLDGFDKRKLPSPGFLLEIVLVDYDGSNPPRPTNMGTKKDSDGGSASVSVSGDQKSVSSKSSKDSGGHDKDDVFSDSETEDSGSSSGRQRHVEAASGSGAPDTMMKGSEAKPLHPENESMSPSSAEVPAKSEGPKQQSITGDMKNDGKIGAALNFEAPKLDTTGMSEFKAIAADASVFSFGDEEDYESE